MGYHTEERTHSPGNWKCAAHGCPLPGGISTNRDRWYCRFHFGSAMQDWDRVSFRINQHADRARELYRLWNDPQVISQYVDPPQPGETRYQYLNRAEMAFRRLIFGDDVQRAAAAAPLAKTAAGPRPAADYLADVPEAA